MRPSRDHTSIRRISPEAVNRSSCASMAGSRAASRSRLDASSTGSTYPRTMASTLWTAEIGGDSSELVGRTVRHDDRHGDHDRDRGRDDDRAKTGPPPGSDGWPEAIREVT